MPKLVGRLACGMFASEMCFILLSNQRHTSDYRYVPIFVGAVSVLLFMARVSRLFSYFQLFRASVVSSAAFVSMRQIVGQLWFPGIVKNGDFMSLENAEWSLVLVATVAVLLFACCFTAWFLSQVATQKQQ